MRWCRPGGIALLGLLLVASASGAGLKVVREGNALSVVLQGLAYPPTLGRDLKSGLTTHILIHLEVLDSARTTAQRDIDVAVRYDLWDENFPLTETASGVVLRSQDFATLEQVMAFLDNLTIAQALTANRLIPGRAYTLRAQVLLNPIERERMERLKQWVAENSGSERPESSASTAPLGRGAGAPPAIAPPDSVFNRIFQQYASGVATSAVWHQTVVCPPFTLQDPKP